MAETLIWVGGLVIEALLATAVVLTVLLRQSRKAQQQLLAQLAAKERPAGEVVIATVPAEAPQQIPDESAAETEVVEIGPVEIAKAEIVKAAVEAREIGTSLLDPVSDVVEMELSDAVVEAARIMEISSATEFDQLREIVDKARLDQSTERLQQRLDITNDSLRRLAQNLEQNPAAPGTEHRDIASIQGNLREMTSEVDILQESSARLQRDLRDKTHAIEQTFAEKHEITERELHDAKKLRRDMTALREKLRNSETDVQKLQTEKEVLAAEYAALNSEYERIYANSGKTGS